MHVTVWASLNDRVEIEKTEIHREMHDRREKLLVRPMKRDFDCGNIVV